MAEKQRGVCYLSAREVRRERTAAAGGRVGDAGLRPPGGRCGAGAWVPCAGRSAGLPPRVRGGRAGRRPRFG